MSDWKHWRDEAAKWGEIVSGLYTGGKITKVVYDAIKKKINSVEELAERTGEASFPEDVELGTELAAEGAEVAVEMAAL